MTAPTPSYSPVAADEADEAQYEAENGVSEKQESNTSRIHPSLYIVNWIIFSNATILFNKWLIDSAGFRYPILLTSWHLVFATLATQLLARTTSLLDSRRSLPLNGRLYIRTILPIGIAYSGSLVCSNLVYLYLSVPFIQMLKSASPVAVLFTTWAWSLADPSVSQLLNILVIVFGVAVASAGEIQFSWIGFFFQVGGTMFEAVRLVMVQVMLSADGLRMNPLVGLYYYAPVCAVMNLMVAAVSEVPRFKWDDLVNTGFGMLFLNALVAFLLNVASVFLIGKTSGLVMTLTGILKNILLIICSVIIWRTQITLVQGIGYSIALLGLTYYSLGFEQLKQLYHTTSKWVDSKWSSSLSSQSSSSRGGRLSFSVTKVLILASFTMASVFTLAHFMRNNEPWSKSLAAIPDWFGQR